MKDHQCAFELRVMKRELDLSGAAGPQDWTCAKKMTEPILRSCKNVYDVAHATMRRNVTARREYDLTLNGRRELLRQSARLVSLDVDAPKSRALMRGFCLGKTADVETVDIFYEHSAEHSVRRQSAENPGACGPVTIFGSLYGRLAHRYSKATIERDVKKVILYPYWKIRCSREILESWIRNHRPMPRWRIWMATDIRRSLQPFVLGCKSNVFQSISLVSVENQGRAPWSREFSVHGILLLAYEGS